MKVGIGPVWVEIKQPFKKLAERRARKKAAKRETTSELLPVEGGETRMAIDLGTRTTTNMTVSGMVVWGILKVVSTYFPGIPTEGLEEAIGAVVAYLIGYFTKTPETPKLL